MMNTQTARREMYRLRQIKEVLANERDGLLAVLTELLDHAEKYGGVPIGMSKTWNKVRVFLGREPKEKLT